MEETLSSAERMAILGQLAAKKSVDEKKETTTDNAKIDDKSSFGSLLEQSLAKQAKNHEEDTQINDEVRKEVIENIVPRFNILSNWRF